MTVVPFDPECITARILAEQLRHMLDDSGMDVGWLADFTGLTDEAIRAWLRGENLKQPVRFLCAVDALGYDVVFRKRSLPPRKVRLGQS